MNCLPRRNLTATMSLPGAGRAVNGRMHDPLGAQGEGAEMSREYRSGEECLILDA
jgi:hypothetical protein